MSKKFKMSKYNYTIFDDDGNLILYNFLTGLNSLTKVNKDDVKKFNQLFLSCENVEYSSSDEYYRVVEQLIETGILVDENVEESIYCDSFSYENIFDSELVLTVLPTGKCNFKCPYCFEIDKSFCRTAMTIENQNALLKFVQKTISKHTSLTIGWFGGEPLLESQIIKYLSENIIKICNTRFIPYSSEMTTNGFLLDEKMFDMLYKLKIYNYQITIDGTKDHHDKYRVTQNGKGTYDVIMSNLLKIKSSKKYRFARILLRVNVLKDSFERFDEFIDCLSSTFGDDDRFGITFMPVANFSNENANNIEIEKVTSKDIHKKLFENSSYTKTFFNEKEERISSLLPKRKCVAARKNTYVIAPDLSVYKCCIYFDHPTNKIGYINSNGDLVIDESKHRKWYTTNKLFKSCIDCFYLPVCKSTACPIRMYSEKKETVCSLKNDVFFKKLSENVIYASRHCDCKQLIM